MRDWRLDEAISQTIFREMNEWTEDNAAAGEEREMNLYLCECGDSTCTDPISLTRNEYEAVRSVPVRFAIAVDHENAEVDHLVREFERYAVVDMVLAAPARVALAADPVGSRFGALGRSPEASRPDYQVRGSRGPPPARCSRAERTRDVGRSPTRRWAAARRRAS